MKTPPFFPTHTPYASGVISPNIPQAEMDATVARLYDEWKARYFRLSPYNPAEAYIHWSEEPGITVSEGHGYGMLAIAAMAGHDPKAQTDFDKMVRFYLAHPSEIDPRLMAWQQDDNGTAIIDIGGVDSATDGDLDIAYALLMADKLWGSTGEFDYKTLALQSMAGTMETIINKATNPWVLTLGDWSVKPGHDRLSTRPSDFMLQHFRTYEAVTGDPAWGAMHAGILKAIDDLYQNHVPNTGLLPNFAKLGENGFEPTDDAYSWDACRIPWRTSMDFIIHGKAEALPMLRTVNAFIQKLTQGDPHNVRAGYKIADGTATAPWNSPAFTGPFMVAAMTDAKNQDWLNALWQFNAGKKTEDGRYYDNCIRLLCMIVASGNWWAPEKV